MFVVFPEYFSGKNYGMKEKVINYGSNRIC